MTAMVLAAVVAGCAEQEVGSQSCPILCPQQTVVVKDTTFDAVFTDTTLQGFPSFGSSLELIVASAGDTLDTRAIIRYDSLTRSFLPVGFPADSPLVPIANPDSARLRLYVDTARSHVPAFFTIEAYDVDTTSADSLTALLTPLFRPDRLIGGRLYAAAELLDTLSVPIDTAKLRAIVTGGRRLRVGLRVVASGSAEIRFFSSETSSGARLYYKAAPDSGAQMVAHLPRSLTPPLYSTLQQAYTDYSLIVKGAFGALPAATTAVGGMPARRFVLTVALPDRIVDSSEVVRATLTLTQRPNLDTYRAGDSLAIYPLVLVATSYILDPFRAVELAVPLTGAIRSQYTRQSYSDSLRMAPRDSGVRAFEMTALLREWRRNKTFLRRVIVFRVGDEGFDPGDLRFFGTGAPASVRPRIRLQYVPAASRQIP
ncbi:MAG: hypothetical protein HYX65_02925 [Gemmatimonadetes bacterium]|nr:hypothetical protein [Gemmatimonadota bacterium]